MDSPSSSGAVGAEEVSGGGRKKKVDYFMSVPTGLERLAMNEVEGKLLAPSPLLDYQPQGKVSCSYCREALFLSFPPKLLRWREPKDKSLNAIT